MRAETGFIRATVFRATVVVTGRTKRAHNLVRASESANDADGDREYQEDRCQGVRGFHEMNYTHFREINFCVRVVPRDGIEPPTPAFSGPRSTI